jgi:hypothetical protein
MHANTFKFWIKVNISKQKTANNGNTGYKRVEEIPKKGH